MVSHVLVMIWEVKTVSTMHLPDAPTVARGSHKHNAMHEALFL